MTRGNRISVYWGGARGDLRISFCHLEACQDVTSKIHFFLSLLRNEAEGRTQT